MAALSRRQVVSPFSSQGTEEWQKVNLHSVSITLSSSLCFTLLGKKKKLSLKSKDKLKKLLYKILFR